MPTNNGDSERPEVVLCYLGPSLPLAKAREILPNAIYRPPAKQGDIVTDVVRYSPNRIILIDGVFRDNLSPWHKEFTWAIQYPLLYAIYGAASMGALRAAELDWLGMVGIGKIYEWYRAGITEDDSEVALSYAVREGPEGTVYYPNTVPLVDIRAGVEQYEFQSTQTTCDSDINRLDSAKLKSIALAAREFLVEMGRVYYGDRTESLCENSWDKNLGTSFPRIPQKALDAVEALTNFRAYEPAPIQNPTPENLSTFFQALYERDRRIEINGTAIPQQHIDSHVILHNPEYERICWDASNQELALMLCDHFCVSVGIQEVERENVRFQQKAGIETAEDFSTFLENNGWSRAEYDRLMIQNTRIRKLQHALTVTKTYRRNTQALLDYLRTHQGFDFWAKEAAKLEARIVQRGADDWFAPLNLEIPPWQLLVEHFEREGFELKASPEEFLLETGFSNLTELGVALARNAAAKD